MKGLYQSFPAFAPDYVGVSSFLFDENALTVFIDPHGCNGQTLYYMDPRFEDFSRMPKSFSCGIREKDAVFGVDKLVEKKVMQILDAVCALWRSQMRFSTAAMRSRTAARI